MKYLVEWSNDDGFTHNVIVNTSSSEKAGELIRQNRKTFAYIVKIQRVR